MRRDHPDIVLLTATVVAPPDARHLARSDPALRLADYLQAFDFYLAELKRGAFDALVLCDNSAFDLAPFAARAQQAGVAGRVELISFAGLDHPGKLGRGFGEFKLVDYAMRTSALIGQAGPRARVWKITGRYRVRNIARLVASQPAQADLYCHCRNRHVPWLDMYVMRWNRRAYEEIIRGVYRALQQDGRAGSAEQRFRAFIDRRPWASRVVRRFRHVPDLDGVRAGDNLSFASVRHRYLLRALALRLAPWWWL